MDRQIILACTDSGKFIKYIPKEEGHTGLGMRHLAIAVLLQNSKGQVLLQKRKHKIFDNIWDLTGATHVLHENNKNETLEEATRRCLEEEWGIRDIGDIKILGNFNYFAKYNRDCEHEYCYLMVGEYNDEVRLNKDVAYEYKWIDKKEFLKDMEQNPETYTPWARQALPLLLGNL